MGLESSTHYLEHLTGFLVKNMEQEEKGINGTLPTNTPDFLKMITSPLTKAIVRLDNKVCIFNFLHRNLALYCTLNSLIKSIL
jgi:hypothetical protein